MKKVVKFGGSSLADAKQIQKAAAIIKADPQRRYVVPSAPGKRFSKDIKVTDVVKIGENYYIKGENFTEFSKVSLDGKILKTVYLGPTILALKEEVDPEDASRMKVSQVEKNKEILSTTE